MKTLFASALLMVLVHSVQAAPVCQESQVGHAIESKPLSSVITKEQVDAAAQDSMPGFQAHFDVQPMRVIYCTHDGFKKPVPASGLWVIPSNSPYSSAVISYQQGTKVERSLSPSNIAQTEGRMLISISSLIGATIVAADYLGLSPDEAGLDPTFHPYLHAETSSGVVIDLIHAIEELRNLQAKPLYLTGYSQGGYVTMAAAQTMITHPVEWSPKLRGVVAMAGPYDLGGVALSESLIRPYPHVTNVFFSYAFLGYSRIYDLRASLESIFQAPYLDSIEGLFDEKHRFSDVAQALPADPTDLFQMEFIRDLAGSDATDGSLGQAVHSILEQNTLSHLNYGNQMLDLPIRLAAATDDDLVPSEDTDVMFDQLTAQGFKSVEKIAIKIPHAPNPAQGETVHSLAAAVAIPDSFMWIARQLSQRPN